MPQITKIEFNGLNIKLMYDNNSTSTYTAVSGRPLYQNPAFQAVSDTGSLPEGKYYINKTDIDYKDTVAEEFAWDVIAGGAWGNARVTLIPDPATDLHGRSGFFLHGSLSTNGYGSAGCIDVNTLDTEIFNKLATDGASQIEVIVDYDDYLKDHYHPVYLNDPKFQDYLDYVQEHKNETGVAPRDLLDNVNKGLTWGDPHLVTYDGLRYDFQAPGEFVLTKSTDGDFEVQVRQELFGSSNSISVNTAVATKLGEYNVGLYTKPNNDATTHADFIELQTAGTLDALAGDDTIFGTASADTITGGDGNDIIQSGGGNDSITGSDGDDVMSGGNYFKLRAANDNGMQVMQQRVA